MSEDTGIPDRKAGKKLTAVFFVLATAVLILVVAILFALLKPTGEDAMPVITSPGVEGPDPVKADIPPNGGTIPSPTGTGPGSNNSLLGPDEP